MFGGVVRLMWLRLRPHDPPEGLNHVTTPPLRFHLSLLKRVGGCVCVLVFYIRNAKCRAVKNCSCTGGVARFSIAYIHAQSRPLLMQYEGFVHFRTLRTEHSN